MRISRSKPDMSEQQTDSKDPTSHWVAQDQRYVWHPYTQMLTAPEAIPVERAEGVYLYTPDGQRILDGISS